MRARFNLCVSENTMRINGFVTADFAGFEKSIWTPSNGLAGGDVAQNECKSNGLCNLFCFSFPKIWSTGPRQLNIQPDAFLMSGHFNMTY